MRRPLTLIAVLAVALLAAGCGNKQARVLHGSTEGAYLGLGPLKYQVQISRLLNPNSAEDSAYLITLPPSQRQPPPGQEWFAVFMRVENDGDHPARAAADSGYLITDTEGTKFRPVSLGANNVFAYHSAIIQPSNILPLPDSPAGQGTIQGAMLLFRIPTGNLENRPLELSIRAPNARGETATVDLDV